MKSLFFFLLLSLAISLNAASIQSNNAPFRITSKNTDHMDIEFSLPSYKIVSEVSANQTFQRIQMDKADYLSKDGMPELPVFGGLIAIPYHGTAQMQIISQQDDALEGITPYPVQSKEIEQNDILDFKMNREYYQSGGKYPEQTITLTDPSIIRDFRVVNFTVRPFEYNATSKHMNVHNKIVFRITFINNKGLNEMEPPLSYSSSFQPIYESLIMNYDQFRDVNLPFQPERILVVYPNSTDITFINKLNDFVNWKQQKGYKIQLASTSVTGTSTSSIKTYIQNAYNNIETRPDYIILIGDATGTFTIPTWMHSWDSYNGEGDYPYTQLAGTDLLGDVYIGRMSISSTSDFLNLVAKGFAYERDMNLGTQQPWLNRMLLVGDNSSSGISTVYTNKFIKDISYAYNNNYTYSEVYSGTFPSQMNQALNTGVGFMNYRGYLGMSSWSPGSSLVNGSKTPHAVVITCGTNTFASDTSPMETFIRLGTAASPAGALTAIGMATWGTHTMLNNCLSGSIFAGLFTYNMHTMG
jgi:hypothetical protein